MIKESSKSFFYNGVHYHIGNTVQFRDENRKVRIGIIKDTIKHFLDYYPDLIIYDCNREFIVPVDNLMGL